MPEMPTRGGFEMLHLTNDLPMPEWRRKKLKDFSSLRERIWLINNWRRRQKIKIIVNQTIGNTSSKTGKKEWDDALFLFWRGNSPAANYNLEDGIRGEGRHQSISRRTLCYIYKYIYKYSVSSLLRLLSGRVSEQICLCPLLFWVTHFESAHCHAAGIRRLENRSSLWQNHGREQLTTSREGEIRSRKLDANTSPKNGNASLKHAEHGAVTFVGCTIC